MCAPAWHYGTLTLAWCFTSSCKQRRLFEGSVPHASPSCSLLLFSTCDIFITHTQAFLFSAPVFYMQHIYFTHTSLLVLCSCFLTSKSFLGQFPLCEVSCHMRRAGQNCIYTPYMTVYSVISLPKVPYIQRICMVLANPTHASFCLQHTAFCIPFYTHLHKHVHTLSRTRTHTLTTFSYLYTHTHSHTLTHTLTLTHTYTDTHTHVICVPACIGAKE